MGRRKAASGRRHSFGDPARYRRHTYYEPFLGGGAIFFALAPKTAVLSDLNSALIETYISVRDHPETMIDELAQLRHNKREYYRVRAWSRKQPTRRAARFIDLNKTVFQRSVPPKTSGRRANHQCFQQGLTDGPRRLQLEGVAAASFSRKGSPEPSNDCLA